MGSNSRWEPFYWYVFILQFKLLLLFVYIFRFVIFLHSSLGEVWPGPCVFPDFTQSKARSWWANLVKDFISNGVDGIWNDMNEPAIFKVAYCTTSEHLLCCTVFVH